MVVSGVSLQSIVEHTKILEMTNQGTQCGCGAKRSHYQVEFSRYMTWGKAFFGRGTQGYYGRLVHASV